MSPSLRWLAIGASFAALLWIVRPGSPNPVSYPPAGGAHPPALIDWRSASSGPAELAEMRRVQAHLLGALRLLAQRDLGTLTPEARHRRARLVGLLVDYRLAGRFPRNEQFPDRRAPSFRDAHGTLCAMAFLIASTGGQALVEHVAATRNNATVAQLADEPGLAEWLDRNGLTLEEAARIQPTYGPPASDRGKVTTAYGLASGVGLGASALGATLAFVAPSHQPTWAGVALGAGAATLALGATRVGRSGEVGSLGAIDMVVGGVAAAAGIVRLALARGDDTRTALARSEPRMRVVPMVLAGRSVGVAGRIRF